MAYGGRDTDTLVTDLRGFGLVAETSTSTVFPGDQLINATAPRADKGRAVAWAAGHLGLSIEQVVAIGGGLNDLSMLIVTGTAIAMRQASAVVRDAAHPVVPEVAEDGFAHALAAAATGRAGVQPGSPR